MTYFKPHRRMAVFDVDGTLIDSMEAWRFAARNYLMTRGLSEGPVDTVAAFDQGGLDVCCGMLTRYFPDLGDPRMLADDIARSTIPLYRDQLPEIPHARAFLRQLVEEGWQLYVLSANLREVIQPGLERLGMFPLFSKVLCCGERGWDKGEVEAYLQCAEELGVDPTDCLVFEDQPFAAESAAAAGMSVTGVCSRGESTRWAALEKYCDLVVADYLEWSGEKLLRGAGA